MTITHGLQATCPFSQHDPGHHVWVSESIRCDECHAKDDLNSFSYGAPFASLLALRLELKDAFVEKSFRYI